MAKSAGKPWSKPLSLSEGSDRNPDQGRRRALGRIGAAPALAVGAGLGLGVVEARALDTPKWMKEPGQTFLSPPYGQPSPFEKEVVRVLPAKPAAFPTATRTPLQNLHGTITPNGLFFERHHNGVPMVDPDQHRLMIHGLVERPLLLTMSDLMRYPAVSRICFLECSGNSASQWASPSGRSAQEIHGLVSCAEWTGVKLSTVLDDVGLKPSAKWILAEGSDAAAMTRSIPIAVALDDAMLVYSQNGEMLRPEQGYPLRLLLPGIEGNMNIKWLRRLKVGAEPFQTREETSKYTDLRPDGRALQFTIVMDAKSVILSPSGGQALAAKGFHEISGIAWSGRGRLRSVDVSVDGGRNWREAVLQEPVLAKSLTRFRLPWRWDGSPAILQSRAVDETGYVQPSRKRLIAERGERTVYHYNGIQSWQVSTAGEVSNVHA
ncbi:MAG: sulfite dehydrogenase [Lautropia sp.]